jgi:hypothetical protein
VTGTSKSAGTWTISERLTDVYLQPQPPLGWLVGDGSGDSGADGVGVASGDSGAVGCGVAVGCEGVVGRGVAVPGEGCALGAVVADGVAELPGPDPAQATSKLLITMIRRTVATFCSNDGCHVIPNGAKRSEESLEPVI